MNNRNANRLLNAIVVALALPAFGVAAAMTGVEYSDAKNSAKSEYKAARARCDRLAGNPKEVCIAEAKAAEAKARAEAEADYKNTAAARRDARIAFAEADYDVAKAKCGARTGNDKDVCMKEAKAMETRAKADAKADAVVAQVRREAIDDKRDAEYKVALERCDSLVDAAKDKCVANTKVRFGR